MEGIASKCFVACSRRAEEAVRESVSRVAAVQSVYTALAAQLQGSMVDFMAEVEATGGSLESLREKLKSLGQCKAQVESVTSGQVRQRVSHGVRVNLLLAAQLALTLWLEVQHCN
jgi:hypothetical protein